MRNEYCVPGIYIEYTSDNMIDNLLIDDVNLGQVIV
jgi:hypothetical protein